LQKLKQKSGYSDQGGFTLVELILVVIIITILALIAIPVFISQREKGWETNVKSDLHNASIAQVTYYQENETYTSQMSDLFDKGYKQSSNISISIESANDSGYCLEADNNNDSSNVWYVDGGAGTPNPTEGPCT